MFDHARSTNLSQHQRHAMEARSHATNKSFFIKNNELISIIDEYKQIVNFYCSPYWESWHSQGAHRWPWRSHGAHAWPPIVQRWSIADHGKISEKNCSRWGLNTLLKFSMLHRCVQAKFLIKRGKFRELESNFFYKTSMQHAKLSKTSKKITKIFKTWQRFLDKHVRSLQNLTKYSSNFTKF